MNSRPDGRNDEASELARRLMEDFVADTGLTGFATPRRYLWTDAFAVCNLLGLAAVTDDSRYCQLARQLVDQVHHILGCHRPDDPRSGWISGADEAEGERHPTRGGLRIGKPLPERGPDEPYDPQAEWNRDGQYYHYLSKWMHALQRTFEVTGEPVFLRWAHELAVTAHDAFTVRPRRGDPPRMVWKMSVDLSRALVPSMGQHDPLDGLVTGLALEAAGAQAGINTPELAPVVAEASAMCEAASWVTDDPLGIGGLLVDVHRLAKLIAAGASQRVGLLERVLDAAGRSLEFMERDTLAQPANLRLAFRELGLALGLRAVEGAAELLDREPARRAGVGERCDRRLASLLEMQGLAHIIEGFWADEKNRRSQSWRDHRDINTVMLAASLAPAGFLAA